MARCTPLVMTIAALLASSTAMAQQPPSSPFMPGGPLAPWYGPLPNPVLAPPVVNSLPPMVQPHAHGFSSPSMAPMGNEPAMAVGTSPVTGLEGFGEPTGAPNNTWPSARPSNDPRMDRHWEPVTSDAERRTYLAVTVNPALMALGKTSGRLELAPLAAHAVFLEVSRLSLFVDDVGRTVSGTEFDVGYHLFPQGKGAHGFYLGPRYLFGSGDIPEASWEFTGVGGDLGYQWVIAHHLVFNLGAGVARVNGKAEINEDKYSDLLDDLPEEDAASLRSLSSQEQAFWVPMVTVGLGLSI